MLCSGLTGAVFHFKFNFLKSKLCGHNNTMAGAILYGFIEIPRNFYSQCI